MTIYPLSGAAMKQSSVMEEAQGYGRRKEMQPAYASHRSSAPRQWELRKVPSVPFLVDSDYWSDASLSLAARLASKLPPAIPRSTEEITALPLSEKGPSSSPSTLPEQVIPPRRSRCTAFPPPLDSPTVCESAHHRLQSLGKVSFTAVRSHGRLVLTQTPQPVQTRRCLRAQRCDGRLLLQLYEESSSLAEIEQSPEAEAENRRSVAEAEEEDSSAQRERKQSAAITKKATDEDPTAGKAMEENPTPEKAICESPTAGKAMEEDPIPEKAICEDPTAGKANPTAGKAMEEDPIPEKAVCEDPTAGKAVEENPYPEKAICDDPIAEKALDEDPSAGKAIWEDQMAEKASEGDPIAEKLQEAAWSVSLSDDEEEIEEEEEDEEGCRFHGDGRKPSLYSKVLRTLERDAFTDYTSEVLNPKSKGVASFLHKSLIRVRPLTMLNLWQN